MSEAAYGFVVFVCAYGLFWLGRWIGQDEGYDRCWNEHHGIPNE